MDFCISTFEQFCIIITQPWDFFAAGLKDRKKKKTFRTQILSKCYDNMHWDDNFLQNFFACLCTVFPLSVEVYLVKKPKIYDKWVFSTSEVSVGVIKICTSIFEPDASIFSIPLLSNISLPVKVLNTSLKIVKS